MKSSVVSSLVVLVVMTAFVVAILFSLFALGDPVAIVVWSLAGITFVVYILLTSIFMIQADEMIAAFFLGTYKETYISGTFAQTTDELGQTMLDRGGQRGLFGWDFVILLWPLWRGVRFPTTTLKFKVHATRVYTKAYRSHSPSLPTRVDTTAIGRLAPDLSRLVQTIDVLRVGPDLTEQCEIRDNLWQEPQEALSREGEEGSQQRTRDSSRHTYRGPLIAAIILREVEETILETVRSVGSEYTWSGRYDIRGHIPQFEKEVLRQLSAWESVFTQAGLLTPLTRDPNTHKVVGDPATGPSALSFDFNVEEIDVESDSVREDLGKPLQGELEGERLRRIAERTGTSGAEVYRGEVVRGLKEVKVIGAGEGVADLVRTLFGGKAP